MTTRCMMKNRFLTDARAFEYISASLREAEKIRGVPDRTFGFAATRDAFSITAECTYELYRTDTGFMMAVTPGLLCTISSDIMKQDRYGEYFHRQLVSHQIARTIGRISVMRNRRVGEIWAQLHGVTPNHAPAVPATRDTL